MENLFTLFIFLGFVIIELILFHSFYMKSAGKKAVYNTWYAWIIDTAAMTSGVFIMGLSLFCLYNNHIFNIQVPNFIFIILFIFGSWQFSIHLTKWIIRTYNIHKIKRKIHKKIKEKGGDFKDEYEREVQEYFKKVFEDTKLK